MGKPEWGTKRVCTACGARFYDLNKDPILCPKCGAEQEKDAAPKARRGSAKGIRAETKKVAVVAAAPKVDDLEDDDLIEDDDGLDEDIIEDTSDLGEDDDDMAEVMEHIEPGEKDD